MFFKIIKMQGKNFLLSYFIFLGLVELCLADYEYFQEMDGWLKLHVVPTTASEARLRCQLEGGTLASPTTDALARAMKTIMYTYRRVNSSVYTDFHDSPLKGDFTSIDGVRLSDVSLQWAEGEPNNVDNNEECLVMTGAGEVADVRCGSVHPYFCYKNNSVMCGSADKGYLLDQRTGSCYKFHSEAVNWRRAAMACAAEGAHLAVINSDLESQVLKELFAKYPPERLELVNFSHIAHIGFWDESDKGGWVTIFGQTFAEAGFGTWDKDEPNGSSREEYCGTVARNGLLNDSHCINVKLAFICEITPKSFP